MMKTEQLVKFALVIGLYTLASGCIIAPAGPRYHDGYWDREHERYWWHNEWHPCSEHGEYCR
jgi:hypothetical protein